MLKSCKNPPVYFESTTGSFYSQYADLPLKSHTIALTATQSGSGTPSPSNPRAISGWSAINIANANEDLYHDITVQNGYLDTQGNVQESGVSSVTDYIPVVEGLVYYYYDYATAALGPRNICIYDDSKQFVSYIAYETVNKKVYFSIPSTGAYVRITIDRNYTNQHLYNGTSATITIGSTVYGGEYDAITGVLTVTHLVKTINDLTGFVELSAPSRHIFRAKASDLVGVEYPPSQSFPTNAICSHFDAMGYEPISASDNGKFAISPKTVNKIVFIAHDYSTVSDFLTAFGTAQIAYPLATPTTIQLPPCPIDTLLGENNIFADCGNTTLEYLKAGR